MRYEDPLYLAEEAASLNQIARGRVALGVSRGAPEVAERGWESFGYSSAAPLENQYPNMFQPGSQLPVFPHSPQLRQKIYWGSGTHRTAEQAAKDGVNLMSSTLVSETSAETLGEIQLEQINRYRAA